MRRVPVLPTALVALAVATMIALGLWQLLIRLPQKEAQLAQLAANPSLPAVPWPAHPDASLLFRRSTVTCHPPVAVRLAGAGAAGFRALATCAPEGERAGATVQLGTTHRPDAAVRWKGGAVGGYLTQAPDARPLIATLFDRAPRPLMLVADTPLPGLARNTAPDVSTVPNSHLAYAGQWFFFAIVAAVIYTLALRRRS